ncbi:MAG TPA: MBL fold metallo-hydrolase, partial [Chitinophagaceae bacterium]|nr:MBL fold metallo-hydrolase [Chitinophagaceae bacterium]
RQELEMWIGYYEGMVESAGDLKITLPDIVFSDSLWILGSDRDVKLMEFKDGHTPSDVVLCIPDERIVFAGDLLFVERHPWMSDGDPASWQDNLQKLYDDKYMQTYVPGHGPVCKKDGVKTLYEYFGTMRGLVDSAVDDSVKSALLLQNIPVKYRRWYFGRFYQNNMKFLMATRRKDTPVPQ